MVSAGVALAVVFGGMFAAAPAFAITNGPTYADKEIISFQNCTGDGSQAFLTGDFWYVPIGNANAIGGLSGQLFFSADAPADSLAWQLRNAGGYTITASGSTITIDAKGVSNVMVMSLAHNYTFQHASCDVAVSYAGTYYDENFNVLGTGATGTGGGSATPTPSPTPTPTPTPTDTPSPTPTGTPSSSPTPTPSPTHSPALCYNNAGTVVSCSDSSCSTLENQIQATQNGTDVGVCGGTPPNTGPTCGISTGLDCQNNTDHPQSITDCIDLIPTEFKFDIPCMWTYLVVPSDTATSQFQTSFDTVVNHRLPFAWFQNLVGVVQVFAADASGNGHCTPVVIQLEHENMTIMPCSATVRDILNPVSTWLLSIVIIALVGTWLYRRFLPSFDDGAGDA